MLELCNNTGGRLGYRGEEGYIQGQRGPSQQQFNRPASGGPSQHQFNRASQQQFNRAARPLTLQPGPLAGRAHGHHVQGRAPQLPSSLPSSFPGSLSFPLYMISLGAEVGWACMGEEAGRGEGGRTGGELGVDRRGVLLAS